jgi:hypothetical protein
MKHSKATAQKWTYLAFELQNPFMIALQQDEQKHGTMYEILQEAHRNISIESMLNEAWSLS